MAGGAPPRGGFGGRRGDFSGRRGRGTYNNLGWRDSRATRGFGGEGNQGGGFNTGQSLQHGSFGSSPHVGHLGGFLQGVPQGMNPALPNHPPGFPFPYFRAPSQGTFHPHFPHHQAHGSGQTSANFPGGSAQTQPQAQVATFQPKQQDQQPPNTNTTKAISGQLATNNVQFAQPEVGKEQQGNTGGDPGPAVQPSTKPKFCFKCTQTDHATKECKVVVFCLICGKDNHITERCSLAKKPPAVAKMVGFAAADLGFFVVQKGKRIKLGNNKQATALVKVKEGQIDATELSAALANNFAGDWEWQVKDYGPQSFLVKFPNLAKIDECSQYEQFKLKGQQVQISVDRWSSAALAKARLHTMWVRAGGVPEEMMSIEGVQEIASSLGAIQQIDLESLNEYDIVRILVDVKDPAKIPPKFEFGQAPFLYDISFQVESVVVQGGTIPGQNITIPPKASKDHTEGEEDSRHSKKPKQDQPPNGATGSGEDGGLEINKGLQNKTTPADPSIQNSKETPQPREEVGDSNGMKQMEDTVEDNTSAMAVDVSRTHAYPNGPSEKDNGMSVDRAGSEARTFSNSASFGLACGVRSAELEMSVEGEEEVEHVAKQGHKKKRGGNKEDPKEPRSCARFSGQEDVNRVEKALERAKFKDLISASTSEEEKRRG